MMNYKEFAQRVKQKNPNMDFGGMDDLQIANAVIADNPQYAKEVTFEEPKENNVLATLKQLGGVAKKAIKPQEAIQSYAQEPEKTGVSLLRGAQFAGGMLPAGISSITTTPATEFAIQKVEGKTTADALKKAKEAAIIDAAMSTATGGVPFVKSMVKAGIKKVSPFATELLAGVPKEMTERAVSKELAGKSIFKSKEPIRKAYESIGEKAQEGISYLKEEAGKGVSKEREALKEIKNKFNFSNIADIIDNLKASKQYGRVQTLAPQDLKEISSISQKLRSLSADGMTPAELYGIRKNIDELVSFQPGTVKKIGSEAEGLLKQSRKIINDKLGEISPKFAEASKKYSDIVETYNDARPKLKDYSVSKNLKNIFSKDMEHEYLFRKIDDALPENMKFVDKLEDTIARETFGKVAPISAAAESPSSLGWMMRGSLLGGAYSAAGPAGLAASTAFSPLAHKLAIKGIGKVADISRMSPAFRSAIKESALIGKDKYTENK